MQFHYYLLLIIQIAGRQPNYRFHSSINIAYYNMSDVFALSPFESRIVYFQDGANQLVFSDIGYPDQKDIVSTLSQVKQLKWFNDGTIYAAGDYWAQLIQSSYPYAIKNQVVMQDQNTIYQFDGIEGLIGVVETNYSLILFKEEENFTLACQNPISSMALTENGFYIYWQPSGEQTFGTVSKYSINNLQVNYTISVYASDYYKILPFPYNMQNSMLFLVNDTSITFYDYQYQRETRIADQYHKVILSPCFDLYLLYDDNNRAYLSYCQYEGSQYSCNEIFSIYDRNYFKNFDTNENLLVWVDEQTMYIYADHEESGHFPYYVFYIAGGLVLLVGVVIGIVLIRRRKARKMLESDLVYDGNPYQIKDDAYYARMKGQKGSLICHSWND